MLFGNQISGGQKYFFSSSPNNTSSIPKSELLGFHFYNPQEMQQIQVGSGVHITKENKLASQSFSMSTMPTQPPQRIHLHNDDGFISPKVQHKFIENVEAISSKKSFFGKN